MDILIGLVLMLVLVGTFIGGYWVVTHATHENQTTDPFGLAQKSQERNNRPL
jgi:uncharacterized protein YneF (UPF0154 family)